MTNKTVNARLAALKIINKVFNEGAYANLILSQAFKANDLSELDRRFITELVYGTVKAKGTLDWILEQYVSWDLAKISPVILNILRMGVYQIHYLERVPDSAACNEAVNLAKKFGHAGTVKFVNGVLRSVVRLRDNMSFPSLVEDAPRAISLKYHHPLWLVKNWLRQFGQEETIRLCQFDNAYPALCMRVNTLLITRAEIMDRLQEDGFVITASEWSPDGIVCEKINSMSLLMNKYGKYVYIQDESSMLVGGLLLSEPVQRVIDVCSAPGGKATHMAQLMQNQGEIIAADIYPHKLKLIEENARRLAITNIKTYRQDAAVLVPAWKDSADAVLADVPCSGLGVLRRRAEARWTKSEAALSALPALQYSILSNAAQYVKVGGRLLYSTCTIEEAENSRVIEKFLRENDNFSALMFKHPRTGAMVREMQLLPQRDGIDGFYIALLQRRG